MTVKLGLIDNLRLPFFNTSPKEGRVWSLDLKYGLCLGTLSGCFTGCRRQLSTKLLLLLQMILRTELPKRFHMNTEHKSSKAKLIHLPSAGWNI